jgi:prepilin-type N-terminal cleavage/methylation domain-containing protein/prepilin-type processing-associated H-X9-DG protein
LEYYICGSCNIYSPFFGKGKAMKKTKGFTLIELLVVISIISLLMAILIPSLGKARELANRIVCGANLKNLAAASVTYANTHDGYFVPIGHVGRGQPAKEFDEYDHDTYGDTFWIQNKAFRSYLHIDSYHVSSNDWIMPKEFLCPSDKYSKRQSQYMGRQSYGYNNTDWRPWTLKYKIVGYKASTVKRPAETLCFVDSVMWWVDLNGAHYVAVWDRIKDLDRSLWPPETQYGPVFYRHNEGAMVGFYDGHAEWLKKTVIFDRAGYCADPIRTGMWTATGRVLRGWPPRWQSYCP